MNLRRAPQAMDDRGQSRRRFLTQVAYAAGGGLSASLSRTFAAVPTALKPARRNKAMLTRPDLLDQGSSKGLEVVQITGEEGIPSSHVYMEAQIFTPDSKRFVLHRSAHAHGSDRRDPEHRYLLCDIEDGCALSPLTEETGATGPSVSPDGRHLYYFVNETEVNGGRLTLKRVRLDGTDREVLIVLDSPLPGTTMRPSHIYPLSTLSSDGKRLAISAFLGDGIAEGSPWGLMVFDLGRASVDLILQGPTWCNLHAQYCRSKDRKKRRDILVQDNHGNVATPQGEVTTLVSGLGADIHVIRDDGSDFRTLPWGRDNNEFCQGHQCWRGRTDWAITSTSTREPPEAQLIEGRALQDAGHLGRSTPGGVRNDLTRRFEKPHFYHFGTDIEGRLLISDSGPTDPTGGLFLGELGEPGQDPLRNLRRLLSPRCSWKKGSHIHPFLSPDGSMGFFNSDESGLLQAYMVRGW